MAEISSFASQIQSSEPIFSNANFSELAVVEHLHHADLYLACDDEIPTIDYSLLFSNSPNQQLHALQCLRHACLEYGFFYVNCLSSYCVLHYFQHISIIISKFQVNRVLLLFSTITIGFINSNSYKIKHKTYKKNIH